MKENNIKNNFQEIKKIRDKALANLPYKIDNINVYTPILKDIFDINEDKYNYYLNLITVDINSVNNDKNNMSDQEKEVLKTLNSFDILISNIVSSRQDINDNGKTELDILNMLEFFLCKNDESIHLILNNSTAYFYIGNIEDNKIIHRQNYNKIVDVIKIQNNITEKKVDDEYKPANDKAAELIKRQKEIDERNKRKNQLTLHDMVSILASKSNNLNILIIWSLNIYQFNDQLSRLPINENYEIQKHLLGNAYAGESIDFEKNNYFIKIKK